MEGIRNACSPDPCEYHQDRGLQFCTGSVERVPCPVPDYAITDKFTYLQPSDIKAGNVTEEYGIDVDRIKLNQRAPNDFCPKNTSEITNERMWRAKVAGNRTSK